MRVALEKLNDRPLAVCENIPAARWELDSADINFVDPIQISATLTKTTIDVVVEAVVTIQKDIICARCLNRARQVVNQKFSKRYPLTELGEYIDIDSDVREEILLNYPMKVLCQPDCKGLCAGCGVNLNNEPCRCMGKE